MTELLNKLNEFYILFAALSKNNPVVAGAVSLWGLGVATYILKGIPSKILNFFERQLTTTMVVNNSDHVYYYLLHWLSEKKMHRFVRELTLTKTNKMDWSGDSKIAMGYGKQYFFFEKSLMSMRRIRNDNTQNTEVKEQIVLAVYKRDQKIFAKLFEYVVARLNDDNRLKTYTYENGCWQVSQRQHPRPIETVTLPKETKDKLIYHIKEFETEKDWFLTNGIPWRTGVMLYGPPGTGKTSIIKALASFFEKNLYILDLENMSETNFQRALREVPPGEICLIEDIDTCNMKNRKTLAIKPKNPSTAPTESKKEDEILSPSLGTILNAIDGPNSTEGRILFATTNFPQDLDAALLREGRFDLKVEIGYMTDECLHEYITRIYGELPNIKKYRVLPNTAPCLVQKLVFENRKSPYKVLEKVAKLESDIVIADITKLKGESLWQDYLTSETGISDEERTK